MGTFVGSGVAPSLLGSPPTIPGSTYVLGEDTAVLRHGRG